MLLLAGVSPITYRASRRNREKSCVIKHAPAFSKKTSIPPFIRRSLLACTVLFLVWLAWQSLSGGFRQIARSCTVGQKVETVIQIECGMLSLLVVVTSFWMRRWAQPVRTLWMITLVAAAGLSSLVWGPPMPIIGAFFAAMALFVSRAVLWALGAACEQ